MSGCYLCFVFYHAKQYYRLETGKNWLSGGGRLEVSGWLVLTFISAGKLAELAKELKAGNISSKGVELSAEELKVLKDAGYFDKVGKVENVGKASGSKGTGNTVSNYLDDIVEAGGTEGEINSKLRNPLDNSKIAKEIEGNTEAVYGYSPKKESALNKFEVDWTNGDEVAYARSERIKYHEKIQQKRIQLEQDIKNLQNDGLSMEEIARLKVKERNQGRMETYIKSNNLDGLNAMKERNILEYGRAEGPTPEQLFKKYGFMGRCDIWQFKNKSSNGCLDRIISQYGRKIIMKEEKIKGNIKWIAYNNLRFRIEKVNDDSSVIWISDNFVNLCFILVINDFLSKCEDGLNINIEIDFTWNNHRGLIIKNHDTNLIIGEIINFISEWELEGNPNADNFSTEEWYSA